MAQPDPLHVTQFGGPRGPLLCTAAVGAMALDAFTAGRIRTTAQRIDELQDDHSGGIGLNDVATAWKRGWGLTFRNGPASWLTLRARWLAGDGAGIQGLYRVVPVAIRADKNFTGGHAIYVSRFTRTGFLRVFDPIRTGPIEWPESVVRNFYLSGLALAGWGSGSTAGIPTATNASSSTNPRPPGVTGDLLTVAQWLGIPPGTPFDQSVADQLERKLNSTWGPQAISRLMPFYRALVGSGLTAGAIDSPARGDGTSFGGAVGVPEIAQAIVDGIGGIVTNAVWLIAIFAIVLLGLYLLVKADVA